MIALTLGLAAAGLTFTARALVPQDWLLVKPWSCDLCMNFHSSWILGIAAIATPGTPMPPLGDCAQLLMASTAVGILATKAANRLSI